MLAKSSQSPLKAVVISFRPFIRHVFRTLLVEGVVCEMDKLILFIPGSSVPFCGKPGETFLENINS